MVGDQADISARIKRLFPAGWFGLEGSHPVVDGLATGFSAPLAAAYSLYAFAKKQTRIATATGAWLEFIAADFFARLDRFTGELDDFYSRRIRLEVLRPRNTREGIDRAIFDLTGQRPTIFEAWRPGDCGGWGMPGLGLGIHGAYGSKAPVYEVLITASLPQNYGIPNRGGWGGGTGAYGVAANFSFVDDNDITGSGATLQQIIEAVERVRTAGVTYLIRFV